MQSLPSTSTSTSTSTLSSHSSSSPSSSRSLQHSSTDSNNQSFQLSPLLLVSTLDGQLHALDRQTGTWNWTLNDPHHVAQNTLLHRTGLVHSPSLSSDQNTLPDQDHELYAIEPHNDGDLYVFIKSSNQPSRLEKLPLSVSQLVNLSPFTFPGDSSKMFIGKKESHLIAIDLSTGSVVNSLPSHPQQASLKGKERSTPQQSFHSSASQSQFTCPVEPPTTNPSSFDHLENHDSIHQRPRDLLYIGRTDYQVSIYSKPNTLIQSLRYSTYTPSNLPHSLQTMWTRTPDDLYLEPTHDGNLVCFQAPSPPNSTTPPTRSEHTKIKWQNSFDHPVTSIFDVVFPSAPNEPLPPPSSSSTDQSYRPSGSTNPNSYDGASKATNLQQPIIFVQPKFLPHKNDQSHPKFSPDDDQFNLFKHLHSQNSFSTPFQPSHPSGQQSAFVGKYQESFYVMSQQIYPLVVFAPSAYQTIGHEPSIGTHRLLNSQAMNGFLDFSYTHRLLDPATRQNHHTSGHSPLALDPPPKPLTLPPPQKDVDSNKPKQTSDTAVPSTHQNVITGSEKLTSESSPVQLHQRAAKISSLLVRTFKQQMLPSEGKSLPSNGRSDDRFPDLNPLLTLFLVLVIMTWWASRKVGSPSTARWDHLHRIVNQALGSNNDSSKMEQAPNLKSLGTADSLDVTATAEVVPTTIPIEEPKCSNGVDASSDTAGPNATKDDDSLLPASKQKPKRRRGKRPGQKAAAAAAKAEAEAAKDLMSSTPSDSSPPQPGSTELVSLPLRAAPEPKTPQKPKPNVKKSKLPSSANGVDVIQPLNHATRITAPVNQSNLTESAPNPTAILLKVNGENVEQSINSPTGFSMNGHGGLEPQKVGSLIVTNEILGYGSHGTVVLKATFQGRQVAVKRLLKDFVTLASHEVSLLQESDDHPNVVRYFVKESLDNFLYIALELCHATLFDLIEKRQFKEYEELDRIFNAKKALKQITSGLRYLHKLKIVHRDIKPQNILISLTKSLPVSSKATKTNKAAAGKSFRMLISDFGLCKKLELDESSFAQTANHAAGSFGYRAPEILKGQVNLSEQSNSTTSSTMMNSTVQNVIPGTAHGGESNGSSSLSNPESSHHRLTRSIDIFSLGCIYYYVLTKGDHPFGSRYEREMNILKDEVCLEQLDGLDEEAFEAQQLIRSMIRSNPKERPTAEEVLQNPYFWEPTKRLNFLCDCSDRFEIMERDPPEESLLRLEDQEQFFRFVNHHHHPTKSLHHHPHIRDHDPNRLDWYKVIDRALVDNLGKYRKYDGGSIRDLLRVMRNKKHHFQDLPEGIKKALGDIPEGFLNYFSRKFPSLLVHVYSVILDSNLKSENLFATYFQIDDL